jgi:spore coat polysaccharide biosynthesis protein SpsF
MRALEKTWKDAKLPSEREHVTTFMKKNKEIFKLYNLENNQKIPIYKLAIDRKEDLEFLRAIAANITKQPILMEDIYELFSQKPEILDLYNGRMNLVEGYSKSLKEDEEFLKKMNKNSKKNNLKSFKETIRND